MKKRKIVAFLAGAALVFTFAACTNPETPHILQIPQTPQNPENPQTPPVPLTGGELTTLPAGTNGSAGIDATYVTFGLWPQTIKADSVTVDESVSQSVGDFTYYKGSDNAWYAKSEEYAYANQTYTNGCPVGQQRSEKYFKVEPIKWRVLTDDYNNSGKKLLLAESILISCSYYDGGVDRTISGATISSNNYEHSRIRAYLNGLSYYVKDGSSSNSEFSNKGFLYTAFTESERNTIAVTSVINNARSTIPDGDVNMDNWNEGNNDNASDTPTLDKLFVLSEQEVSKSVYAFADYDASGAGNSRIRIASDFAKANRTHQSNSPGMGGYWWLRSPIWNTRVEVNSVLNDGNAEHWNDCRFDGYGVVPALCLN